MQNLKDLHPVVAHHVNVAQGNLVRVYAMGVVAALSLWALGVTFDRISSNIVAQQQIAHYAAR